MAEESKAQIFVASKTSTSVTVYLGNLDEDYSYNDRRLEWYIDDETTYRARVSVGAGVSQSAKVEITGLSPNTTYTIRAYIIFNNNNDYNFNLYKTVKTNSSEGRPKPFEWTYEKVTENLYLSADEWNELTENINAVRKYKDLSNYSFTTAVKQNRFTASIYNQAVNAIKGISGYGTSLITVSQGEQITAKLLNDLVSAINKVQ